jgi:hypothetical protein
MAGLRGAGRLRSGLAGWFAPFLLFQLRNANKSLSLLASGLRIGLPPYLERLHLGTTTDTFPVTTSRLNPTATEGDDRHSNDDGGIA